MSAIANRKDKDRKRRARLRKRLEASGVAPEVIERIIAVKREDDLARCHGYTPDRVLTREEILANTDDSLWPDDRGYRPSRRDPLLHGAARATGTAAKVVRRRYTITRYQYERMEER